MGAWKYWRELPYRDKSKPDDEGKFKNRREIQRARRQNTIIGLTLFGFFAVITGFLVFADDAGNYEGTRNFLLVFGGVFVLMLALARWTDSMNSYLRADDLDPRYLSEEEDEANGEDSSPHAPRHERHSDKQNAADREAPTIRWRLWWLLVIITTAAYIVIDLKSLQTDSRIYFGLGILGLEVLILFIPVEPNQKK